jgi:pectate lyase
VHVFNNYYTPADDLYCIRPGVQANLLVENNYFDGAQQPFDAADPTASIAASGNMFVPDAVNEPSQGEVFDPPYPYALDDAADVPAIVQAGAGAT